MTEPRLGPGATLGVVGGGQLGRMFAIAAARLGFQVRVFAPEQNPPAAQVAAGHTRAAYTDMNAVRQFAGAVQAATYEFENIPAETMEAMASLTRVRPASGILAATRQRIREKEFLRARGIPVTPFVRAGRPEDIRDAVGMLGPRMILKTAEWGYDGKGQRAFTPDQDPAALWEELGNPAACIVEKQIDLAGEFSMIVARDSRGHTVFYGPFHNEHRHHILDTTTWSAQPDRTLRARAEAIASAAADAFELVGLICIECFMSRDGEIMVNEIAPRPHNSGHLTIEALSISQFEQQARLSAGWDAIAPVPRAPAAAMVNLLGDLWAEGEPDWDAALSDARVSLHLYGKTEARPGRKMGHLTVLADTPDDAARLARDVRRRLAPHVALPL